MQRYFRCFNQPPPLVRGALLPTPQGAGTNAATGLAGGREGVAEKGTGVFAEAYRDIYTEAL